MSEIYIGLMSGTSVDAVDAVAVSFSEASSETIGSASVAIDADLRSAILDLCGPGMNEIEKAQYVENRIAVLYAEAVGKLLAELSLKPADIRALGAHGQTVRHRPEAGATTQLINGALLAELTGIDTIVDFRSRDIAAGGQGAPLVPAFHRAWFESAHPVALLNIGGIANVTVVPPAGSGETLIGFDTGPGNMLMDAWIEKHLRRRFDEGGRWAAKGEVIVPMLDEMLREPYFARSLPKSTGRELFNLGWLQNYLTGEERAEDVQRTLLELTAVSIAAALRNLGGGIRELYVCGGGSQNPLLMERIRQRLPEFTVGVTDDRGLATQDVEGAAFAWLAKAFVDRICGNDPSVTGASGPRILGCLYPA